ncbi:DMSO/TMAO reductase YedYZ, molybdopterin-dependent catalytic subunit [Microbispora rosea]|uniref:DMSO/TMAO reductase YedYZ, molybdopterin-dependent catalytic subunit n=1 Tax=Microbispora rosea TaxID=58117 RepID=A0A1N7DUB8_9ACTN|nr:molybdopterin-binding protein [Microbispora rosea subsp. rosea]SIR79399.1 DMSO/TMAO reductase YedYZ, molybdopterin-dependent catalytic subunit [Microbispora rosea]
MVRDSVTRDRVETLLRSVPGRFGSVLHSERVAARLGLWLGISFTVAFATGLFSHFMQHPPGRLAWPSRPVGLYRITQGLHVIGGLATIPLLLAKLWTVYPKLWQWPPFRSLSHAVERGLVLVLVGASLFQSITGLLNISYVYLWPFSFPAAHYWTAYLLYGALIIHVVNEWAKVRRQLWTREQVEPREVVTARRRFLGTVAAASGLTVLFTVGETYAPLSGLALLAPREPHTGPQGLPVNKSAAAAGVTTVIHDPGYRLTVTGAVRTPLSLTYDDLLRLPQHTVRLPIACVEGWSAEAEWSGIRLRDLAALAGIAPDAVLTVESLERGGGYRSSEVRPPHWNDQLTLLALRIGGAPLAPDHGFPVRLIAPNRPGVLQTKWVSKVVAA